MLNIDSKLQEYVPGCEPWRSVYSEKKLELLENSWAEVFRRLILPYLPVKEISKNYSARKGRKTKELYALTGLVVLQEFFDVTDVEAIRRLAFDQEWHYSLECYNESDQITSLKTLWTMRKVISDKNLAGIIFDLSTEAMIKAMGIDVSKQRLDSVHVNSNMAHLGRIRIFAKAILKFLKNLKRHHEDLYDSIISEAMNDKYFKKDSDSYFNQIKPSDRELNLQGVADDTYFLIVAFQNEKEVQHMSSYKLLCQIIAEQCIVDSSNVIIKAPKEVPSDSIQNPSDPDAGYDAHKGQGYQTQIVETYKTEEDRKGIDGNKPDMIIYVETESADKHDANALEPALKDITERGLQGEKLLADAAYGGTRNTELAAEYGVQLIAPTLGKTSEKGHEAFEFDPDTFKITGCLAGLKPDKIQLNKKLSITAIWFEDTCKGCEHLKDCPTKKCTKGRSHYYTISSIKCHLRRIYEKSAEFKEEYRYRSGIEGTNSRFISMTKARRSRYRGLEKMSFSQILKALAINMFRVSEFESKLGFCVHKYVFFINFRKILMHKKRKNPNHSLNLIKI